ncbi:MAG: hypothetical protein K9L59_16710 [Desulfobacterales bacterium]|nr:hypothetical protein [Desulfobacterales bacterium]
MAAEKEAMIHGRKVWKIRRPEAQKDASQKPGGKSPSPKRRSQAVEKETKFWLAKTAWQAISKRVSYDGKKSLTYTRRIEDFPLARVYSKYVKEGTVLPIDLAPDHLVLDLSQMVPKGVRIDLKKILSVKNLFPAGKKGERN